MSQNDTLEITSSCTENVPSYLEVEKYSHYVCTNRIKKIKETLHIAAQNYTEIKEKIKICGSNVEKYVNKNQEIQEQIDKFNAKHREEMQILDDKLVSIRQDCNNQLENQHKETERRNDQLQNCIKDYSLTKDELCTQTIELISLREEQDFLKSEKSKNSCLRKMRENSYSKLNAEIEEVQKINTKVLNMMDEIKSTVEKVSKVSQEYQAAIASKSKCMEFWEEENEKLRNENSSLFGEIEKKKKDGERAVDCDFPETSSQKRLFLESEMKFQDEIIVQLSKRKETIEQLLQKANQTIQNYQEIEHKWEETERELFSASKQLKLLN